MRPKDLASEDAAKRHHRGIPAGAAPHRVDSIAFPSICGRKQGERIDCLASSVVERSADGDSLRTVVVYTEVGQQARHRATLSRALSRGARDAAHGRCGGPDHSRERSLAQEARLSPRRSARQAHHGLHGRGVPGHARRRPSGRRDRARRARERAAHLCHQVGRDRRGTAICNRGSRSDRRSRGAHGRVEGRYRAQPPRAPTARRFRGECAPARRARARARLSARRSAGVDELRPNHRREPGPEENAGAARGRRADVGKRADPGRVRRRQGARCARDPRAQPAQPRAARQGQLRIDSARAVRERILRPREGRVHRRASRSRRAVSSSPTAERFFSTRSAKFRSICRASCCACCRRANTSASATIARTPSTSASSRQPTATSSRQSPRENFARTSTTASASSPSMCRRCANAATTSCRSRATSSRGLARNSATARSRCRASKRRC